MMISAPQLHVRTAGHVRAGSGSRSGRLRERAAHGGLIAGTALRCLVLLLGAVSWGGELVDGRALAAGALVAVLALAAAVARPLPSWGLLLADGAALGLLVYATGAGSSPFLTLTLALVALGALGEGRRDALIGGGIGVLLLLAMGLADEPSADGLLFSVAVAQAAAAGLVAWALGPGSTLFSARPHEADEAGDAAQRSLEWQRLNLSAVSTCATPEDLRRRAAERAVQIAAAPATVDLGDGQYTGPGGASGYTFSFAVREAAPGRITVHGTALSQAQREALEHLATLVGMRASELRYAQKLERQQEAMQALWEAAGIVRLTPGLDDTVRHVCRRLAEALELEWLAVVGPSDRQTIAPLLVARGRPGDAPRMQGAQLRVAAEAIRTGRPLVRSEGDAALACLPMRLAGDTPLALVALGDTGEAGTQALLMVFGDMLAQGLGAA
ncbi:MAG: hypothetical protein DIU80_015495 [Chloroflexota bacterium]